MQRTIHRRMLAIIIAADVTAGQISLRCTARSMKGRPMV